MNKETSRGEVPLAFTLTFASHLGRHEPRRAPR